MSDGLGDTRYPVRGWRPGDRYMPRKEYQARYGQYATFLAARSPSRVHRCKYGVFIRLSNAQVNGMEQLAARKPEALL